jgi:hypothetical protein
MPTFTLSLKDAQSFRTEVNRILHDLKQAEKIPALAVQWTVSQQSRELFTNLQLALEDAETVGAFDPSLALQVLHRVSLSGPGKSPASFDSNSDSQELLLHVKRLAGFGMFEVRVQGGGQTMLTVGSGLQGDGPEWLRILRDWDIATPFLKKMKAHRPS